MRKQVNVTGCRVWTGPVMFQVMPGKRDARLIAPLFERQRPVFDPELVHQIVEIVANGPVVADVEIDAGEMVAQLVSAALRKLAEHVGCQVQTEIPGTVPLGGEMRL